MGNGRYKLVEGTKISKETSKLLNVQALINGKTNLFALHGFDLDISLEGVGNVNCTCQVHNVSCLHTWHGKDNLKLLAMYMSQLKSY